MKLDEINKKINKMKYGDTKTANKLWKEIIKNQKKLNNKFGTFSIIEWLKSKLCEKMGYMCDYPQEDTLLPLFRSNQLPPSNYMNLGYNNNDNGWVIGEDADFGKK